MSILIKGMEMPETHPLTVTIYPDGRMLSETVGAKDKHGIAVPVPPHGRLIDADKLCLSSGFSTATEYGMGRSDQIEAIKSNAPTIIQAEEGEI